MPRFVLNGIQGEVPEGSTILDAAESVGVDIPTLCYLKGINEIGSCRICVVEVEGVRNLQPACVTPVNDGMRIWTNTQRVRNTRKTILELILSDHDSNCNECARNGNCELQSLSERLGVRNVRFEGERSKRVIDDSTPSLVRNSGKCILCRRCVSVCSNIQSVSALAANNRGFDTIISPLFEDPLSEAACALCGQCSLVCPTGAIVEKDDTEEVWRAIHNTDLHVVVQTAPAVRASLGEALGLEAGSLMTKKMVAALRRLGFDKVFDTDFTADLTIIEEGNELLQRLQGKGRLPMLTSCSPGWIKFIEHFYPDLLPHLSTCKSPQQMFGALAKTYYAKKAGIDPSKIFVVSIMPCTAKKFEAKREEMKSSGYYDVDVALTTRELARMIKEAGIDINRLEDEEFDAPLGISTGAGVIFGSSGGVMEAALRTVYEVVTGEELEKIDFESIRGLDGIKEAVIPLGDKKIKIAVANGLGNARKLLELIRSGAADYHFIEIMSCPGGCIGGGGQPIPSTVEVKERRMRAIYEEDRGMPLRKSHKNPAVMELYREFLKEPLGELSHKLLHTRYTPRSKYPKSPEADERLSMSMVAASGEEDSHEAH